MPSAQATGTAQLVAATSTAVRPLAQHTATATAQAIQVGQSTEVVQTLLHGSISCLAYLRSLFGESCFDDQCYETNDAHCPYAEYAAGRVQPRAKKETGTRIKVLRRGRSNAADLLLDWLEKGAFDALKRNVLRALQIDVFEDPRHPANILELYTFTFRYSKSSVGARQVVGMEMTGPQGTKVTVQNAKYAMQMFIRRLIALCGTLPNLPRRRYLTMHLFYTDDCPADYQPSGFEASKDNAIFFPTAEWKKVTADCGGMDAGFHNVSLKVSHLHFTPPEENACADPDLPNDLVYSGRADREDDIDSPPGTTGTGSSPDVPFNISNVDEPGVTKSRETALPGGNPNEVDTPKDSQNRHSVGLPPKDSGGQTLNTLPDSRPTSNDLLHRALTQQLESAEPLSTNKTGVFTNNPGTGLHSDDLHIKERLQQLLEPPVDIGNAGDTQIQSQSLHGAGNISNLPNNAGKVQLSQSTIQELEGMRSGLLPHRMHPSSTLRRTLSGEVTESGERIECQCGWNEEEDDMISCGFCDSWQHLCCYGFRGCEDPRIPSIHACYRCLLEEKEGDLFREMRNLCLLRRGITTLEEYGYISDKDLSTKLHCDLQTASRLATHLRKEGYLVPAPGSKRREYKGTGKLRSNISKAEDVVSRMMKQYFDPLAKIAHHFEAPLSNEPVTPTARRISEGREQDTQTDASAIVKDGWQASRYALRPRTPGAAAVAKSSSRGETGTTSLGRKRARVTGAEVESWTPRAKRRLRSSVARGLINVEEFMTPSPHNGGVES